MSQISYGYNHKRKEVTFVLQVGSQAPVKFIMAAEAFIQDLESFSNDPQLAHYLAEVRRRKDLPIDYDFGAGGNEIKFEPKEWENKMEDKDSDKP